MAIQVGVPAETVSLLLVAPQSEVWVAHTRGIRLGWMLGVVKDQNVRGGCLGSDDTRILKTTKVMFKADV